MNLPGSGDDFRSQNLKAWVEMLHSIFTIPPERAIWTDNSSIVAILQKIGSVDNLAHFFFPDGGGLDLDGAVHSVESSCIELRFRRIPCVLKPRDLTFESFGPKDLAWAYFRIEADELVPSGEHEEHLSAHEELTEIHPGEYIDRSAYDSGQYELDGELRDLPEGARCVMRYLSGSFVLFAKGSLYNRTHGTYDGRHAKMSAEQFRAHISLAKGG